MKKVLLAACAALCVAQISSASLQVGDAIRFIDRPGHPGGEFGVAKLPDADTELFVTFCIERNEFLDFDPAGFVIDSISTSAYNGGQGGGNPDPLSSKTAWLYYNFTKGTLAGYIGDAASANSLQNALWSLEDETSSLDALANTFLAAADAASASDLADAAGRVRALNISWATSRGSRNQGDLAQSVLYVIPEASTMIVWSALSALGLVAYRKRMRQA